MSSKTIFRKNTIRLLQQMNVSVFPVLVLFFLLFALTEEIKPGFVTFYVSQWLIIIPVVVSGILFATTEQKPDTSPLPTQLIRVLAIGIFQILFSAGFFWKVQVVPLLLFWGLFIVSFILFLLFQVALLFTDTEINTAWKKIKKTLRKKTKLILSVLFFGIICVLLFFFFLWVKNPYFFTFQDTVPVKEIWEKAIYVPEEKGEEKGEE